MNKLSGLLIFMLGIGVGSGTTYYILRDKFDAEQAEREAQIKAVYDEKYRKDDTKPEKDEVKEPVNETITNSSLKEAMLARKKDIKDYTNIVNKEQYTEEKETNSMIDGEILIEPDNHDDVIGFGLDPYDVVFATIYADGYLVDSSDNIIDIDEQIGGRETLEHFGEGDDPELLHVRNNLYEIDYEIDRDDRTYAEVSGKSPSELPPID